MKNTKNLLKKLFLDDHWEVPEIFKTKHIPSLDGLRALSIIIVLFSHLRYTPNAPSWIKFIGGHILIGDFGVQVFFLISGFLITGLLLKEKIENKQISLRSFYWRRFIRIFPVFYLFLVVAYIVVKTNNLPLSNGMFVITALYLQNFSFLGGSWIVGHSWSLAVEEQFYLLWPFLVQKKPKYIILIILAICLLHPIVKVLSYNYQESSNYFLAPIFNYFPPIACGALLAIALFKGWMNHFTKRLTSPLLFIFFPLAWLMYLPGKLLTLGEFSVHFAYLFSSISLGVFLLHILYIPRKSLLIQNFEYKDSLVCRSNIVQHLFVAAIMAYS